MKHRSLANLHILTLSFRGAKRGCGTGRRYGGTGMAVFQCQFGHTFDQYRTPSSDIILDPAPAPRQAIAPAATTAKPLRHELTLRLGPGVDQRATSLEVRLHLQPRNAL